MCSIGEVEGKNDEKTDKEEIKLRKESFLVALTAEVLIGHSGAPKIDWGGGGYSNFHYGIIRCLLAILYIPV